jgi:hypothetical protein
MHKIACEKCGVGLFTDIKLKEWVCSPCQQGLSPTSLTCKVCSLSNGVLISTTSSEWLHLFCALLLKQYIKSSSSEDISNCLNSVISLEIPEDLTDQICAVCGKDKGLPVILCQTCSQNVHISCIIQKNWKIIGESLDCGCCEKKKSLKRSKTSELPPIRGPQSCLILEHIMEKIVKCDHLMIFREKTDTSNKDLLLEGLSSKTYIDVTEDSLFLVISKTFQGSPTKKQKLSTPAGILDFDEISDIVTEDEPRYVQDYEEYEKEKLVNFDHMYKYFIRGHAYFTMSQVIQDFRHIIMKNLAKAKTTQEKIYINRVWELGMNHLMSSKKSFEEAVLDDWKTALETNRQAPRVTSSWHKEAFESRNYEMISDYKEVSKGTKSRLETRKKGKCEGNSCSELQDLGPFNLINCTWESTNPDRVSRVECSEKCLCDQVQCKNRQISLKQFQKLDEDVKEIATWGFDVYTYRNLMAYMRHPVSNKMHKFISRALPKAINSVKRDNWNILRAFEYILEDFHGIFKLRDKRYAAGLKNAIEGLAELIGIDQVLNEFQIHPKGTGVICANPRGIPRNSLIVEYFGQLFSPAKWYEKQDLIKGITNQLKKKEGASDVLPDFYNIMLERHHDDPDGYDILIVDPIFYGSYGSRLSHSCTPNCGTVTMVAQGKYSIGMYALSDIKYLDELTFDYNSITESKEEHLNAVCLCASSLCRSFYLAHAQNSSNIPNFHNFLHRASLMVKASIMQFGSKESEICEKYFIRNAVLENSPEWLKVWIALVLEVVDKEAKSIQQEIYKKLAIDSRLQNLVMTVDKIKYCMQRTNIHPPYRLLTPEETLDYLWGSGETSIRKQLKKLFQDQSLDFSSLDKDLPSVIEAKKSLLKARDLLRKSLPNMWRGQGIADILHLIAFTRVYFSEIPYSSFESDPVSIRHCEVSKASSNHTIFKSLKKKYSAFHIQGTLSGWYKQTVEKPASSLSADKRGTLSVSSLENPPDLEYSAKTRSLLLEHLKEKPASAWPAKANCKYPWGNFTNKAKVLGTPMFDACFFDDPEMMLAVLACIDRTAEKSEVVESFHGFN